jgi:hypothetical protein
MRRETLARSQVPYSALPLSLALNALENFFAVDGDILRSGHTDTHLAALHIEHGDRDRVSNGGVFTDTAREDQHKLFVAAAGALRWRPVVLVSKPGDINQYKVGTRPHHDSEQP